MCLSYSGYIDSDEVVHYSFKTKEFGVVNFKCNEDWLHKPNPVIVLMELSYSKRNIRYLNNSEVYDVVEKLLDKTKNQEWVKLNMSEWLDSFKMEQYKELQEQTEIVNYWCKD